MQQIRAIGFDLFDTLITVAGLGFREAIGRLIHRLQEQGVGVEAETFVPVYRDAVKQFRQAAQPECRETHNRFWISAALRRLGYNVASDDDRVAAAVEAYFSAFLDHATLLPDTRETLAMLKERYRLGLLSNFTHPPAVRTLLERHGLAPYLDPVVISGDLGYRKPHRRVFGELERQFGLPGEQIAFVGDDLEADVNGARQAGLQPIWSIVARRCKGAASTPADQVVAADVPTIASWSQLLTLLGLTQRGAPQITTPEV